MNRQPRTAFVSALSLASALICVVAWAAPPRKPAAAPPRKPTSAPALPELVMQTGHVEKVGAVAWSPDGQSVASAGEDGKILVWSVPTGQVRVALTGHRTPPTCTGWSPDGQTLVTGHGDGTVRFWDPRTGKLRREVTLQPFALSFTVWSPDGKTLACGGWNRKIFLWDARAGKVGREIEVPSNAENQAAWSPDGRTLATAGASGKLRLWDPAAGTLRRELEGHTFLVSSLAWSPDGRRVATGGWDATVRIWDPAGGEPARTLSQAEPVYAVAWTSPERLAIASQGGKVQLWDVAADQAAGTLEAGRGTIQTLVVSPKRDHLAVGSTRGDFRLWDLRTGKPARELTGYGFPIYAVTWSADGRSLASGGWAGGARLWDTATGEGSRSPAGSLFMTYAAAWSPDGSRLAQGGLGVVRGAQGPETRTLSIWNRATGQTSLEVHTGASLWVSALDWSPDGRILAVGDLDGAVAWVEAATGRVVRRLSAHKGPVTAVEWSPDGKRLLSSGDDGAIRLWDGEGAASGEIKASDGPVRSAAWAPDGARIAAGDLYGKIRVWGAATLALQREWKSPAHWVEALVWSPKGDTLVSGTVDGVIRVWDVATGAQRRELRGHSGLVTDLVWSPGGERLASSSGDGAVRVWSLAGSGSSVALVPLRGEAEGATDWIALTAQGYYDGSQAAAQRVTWRVGADLFPAARYASRFQRPGLIRRALAGETLSQATLSGADVPPGAQILSPRPGTDSRDPYVEVELFAADDRQVQEAELFVNGRPLAPADARPLMVGSKGAVSYGAALPDGSRPIMLGAKPLMLGAKPLMMGAKSLSTQHRTSRTFRFRVPMPPGAETVNLRAVVYDDQGYNSEPVDIVIRRSGAPDVKGTLHALCVGVSRYKNPAFNLNYAARDAEDMAGFFLAQQGLYRAARVTGLTDAEATSTRIRAALAEIQKSSRPSDTVVLFLSGHGVEDAEGRYYFASHDVDPNALSKTAVTVEQLQGLLGGKLRARNVFVFADTCHSGRIPARPASNSRLEALKTVVLASSQGGEFSFERDEWGHGAFTLSLLEGLKGKADPGSPVVHFDALAFYVRKRVQELVGQAQQVTVSANGVPLGTAVAQN